MIARRSGRIKYILFKQYIYQTVRSENVNANIWNIISDFISKRRY